MPLDPQSVLPYYAHSETNVWGFMTYNSLRPEGSAIDRLAEAVRAHLDRPLVLVGLMGAGKTRLGRMMAKNLKLPFYDCDEELARAAGRTVPEIVDQIGETAFHQAEARVLHRLLSQGPCVISTGGGADTESAIVPGMLKDQAVTLWVRASLDLMIDRTTRNTTQRPFLKDKDIPSVMTDLVNKLHPLYAQADAVVESRDCPASETLYQAMAALAQSFSPPAADVG
jgi:shikimate kinase